MLCDGGKRNLTANFCCVRLAVGAFSRLPRVNPKEPVQYEQWSIPPGVSFLTYFPNLLTNIVFVDRDRNVESFHLHVS